MQTKLVTMTQRIAFVFSRIKTLSFLVLVLFSFAVNAQRDEEGFLTIDGTTFLDGKKLKGAIITIYKDDIKGKQNRTKKSGKFSIELPFGSDYKITFSYPGCIEMQVAVFAKIPQKKSNIWPGYGIKVHFFHEGDTTIDLSKYQFPFAKVIFDGKEGFKDDEKYMDEFKQGIFIEYVEAKKGKEKSEKKTLLKRLAIAGKIFSGENRNKPLANTKIILVNEKGDTIQSTVTNAFGKFVFTELPPDQNLLLKINESDNKLSANTKITVTTKSGKEIMTTTSGEKGEFDFKFITADQDVLKEMAVEDNSLLIAGNLLSSGANSSLKPVPNVKMNLVNEKGDVVQTVTTNALGGFVFSKLPPDQNFIIKMDENDTKLLSNTKMLIATKNGKEITSTTADANGKFSFQFLAADKNTLTSLIADDAELKTDLKGKLLSGDNTKKALAGLKVSLMNDKSEIVQTTTTDAEGRFQFFNLPPDQNYVMSIDEKDTKLASLKQILLVDEAGKTIKEINADNNKTFSFQFIAADQKTLSTVYVDDPWLKAMRPEITTTTVTPTTTTTVVNDSNNASDFSINASILTIRENIYFNVNDYQLLPEAKQLLDKVVEVMKTVPSLSIELSSHTDSQGSKEYNMELSKKRAKAAVDYIVAHGISSGRITGKGYGETKLVNNCGDGVKCSEEEHAKNRRLEFIVERK